MVIDYTGSNSNLEENLEILGKIPTELEIHVYKSTSSKNVYGIIDISYYEHKEKKENLKWVLSGKVFIKIEKRYFFFWLVFYEIINKKSQFRFYNLKI